MICRRRAPCVANAALILSEALRSYNLIGVAIIMAGFLAVQMPRQISPRQEEIR